MQTKEENRPIRVAIVQASPVPFDLAAPLAKALALLQEAAGSGVQLVCFGEIFLPGYPAWLDYCPGAALWNHPPVKEVLGNADEQYGRAQTSDRGPCRGGRLAAGGYRDRYQRTRSGRTQPWHSL